MSNGPLKNWACFPCQQNSSKTIEAGALKLDEQIGSDEQMT